MADTELWKKRVADWRASGVSAAEYCKGQAFTTGTLYRWSSRLTDAARVEEGAALPLVRMVRDTGFALVEHTFNRPEPSVTRLPNRLLTRLIGPLLRGLKGGDCHIFVLRRS